MAVAPSFKNFPIIGDVFIKNGRKYVKVKNPSTGNVREVRWYNEQEMAKNYGKKVEQEDGFDGLKKARGFEKGPILVIRGIKGVQDEEWCNQSIARFAVGIGWYFTSEMTFPDNTPDHFKYLLLSWDEFRDKDDRHMKSASKLSEILSAKAKKGEWFNIK